MKKLTCDWWHMTHRVRWNFSQNFSFLALKRLNQRRRKIFFILIKFYKVREGGVGKNISMNLHSKACVSKHIVLGKNIHFYIFVDICFWVFFEWNIFVDTCFKVYFWRHFVFRYFCRQYPTMLDCGGGIGEGGGVRGGVIGEWMIRYKKKFFYFLDNPLLFSFYSFETYIGLLQFSLSLVMAE